MIYFEGWEQKRSKCFFTYIHLDLFSSQPSICLLFKLDVSSIPNSVKVAVTGSKGVAYVNVSIEIFLLFRVGEGGRWEEGM